TAQVGGKVVEISDSLLDGSFFEEGEILLRIDEEDFVGEQISAKANLARAKADFAQEQAKSKQARLNWEDLGYKEEPNELVLRLPQLREAEAVVEAAEAALERANRNLERASIKAPFAGRVLTRQVSVGQTITPSTGLATVFETDFVEVRLPVPAREMPFLTLPESVTQPSVPVELRDALNSDSIVSWKGEIVGTEGALDPDSRELFAIARVTDPYSRDSAGRTLHPPLRIGQPVAAEIEGRILSQVFVIPRDAVRELRQIHLIDPKELTLTRHEIEAVWSNEEFLIVADKTIPNGALLSVTRLVYAPDGSKVEIIPSTEETLSEVKLPTLDARGT
ncbi:MAG: efflux RND transporter periplasmic adaptor subunit, partial [Verrucomicrobiota bacterium]